MDCPLKDLCPKIIESRTILHPRLILGEGPDDRNFLDAFLRVLGFENVQAMSYGGRDNLPGFLELLVRRQPEFRGVTHIAVTADSDEAYDGCVAAIQAALHRYDLPVPVDQGFSRLGARTAALFIVREQLETLCLESIRGSPVAHCIDAYLDCIEYVPSRRHEAEKVRSRLFMASREASSVVSLGVGAQRGYWDFQSPAFGDLRRFLTTLAS